MIAKGVRFFVVMNALSQVQWYCRTERLLSHSHDVTGKVVVLVTQKGLDTYFYFTSLMMILLFLVAIFPNIQGIFVSMAIAQCQQHVDEADHPHKSQ